MWFETVINFAYFAVIKILMTLMQWTFKMFILLKDCSSNVAPIFTAYIDNMSLSFRSFMRHRGLNPSRWACETMPHPIQNDATSCGAYALKVCITV